MKKSELQKIIKEEVSKVVSEISVTDEYFDVYIAKQDTMVENLKRTRRIKVPKGTVISAAGGGIWKSVDGTIQTGISSLKNNGTFEVVNNPTRAIIVDLVNDVEKWGENTYELIQKDPANAKQIVADRLRILKSIKSLLK